jgi:hypothetical protein
MTSKLKNQSTKGARNTALARPYAHHRGGWMAARRDADAKHAIEICRRGRIHIKFIRNEHCDVKIAGRDLTNQHLANAVLLVIADHTSDRELLAFCGDREVGGAHSGQLKFDDKFAGLGDEHIPSDIPSRRHGVRRVRFVAHGTSMRPPYDAPSRLSKGCPPAAPFCSLSYSSS